MLSKKKVIPCNNVLDYVKDQFRKGVSNLCWIDFD